MPTGHECEECNEVKRCRMYMDDTGPGEPAPIYLCAPCARDHGFLPDPARAVERKP